jgi:thioredoxin-like negative regulator of GroEL
MRSALIFTLATLMILAFLAKEESVRMPKDPLPQASPRSNFESVEEKPKFTNDYESAMKESDRRVMLVFSADWCGHCVSLKEHLKSMDLGDCLVCIVDADQNRAIKRRHSVRSLPTSIIIKEGKEISRNKGFDVNNYDAWFNSVD